MKLGKKAARPNAVKLRLSAALPSIELPTPPPVFGRPGLVPAWGILGNDKTGDCVFAGAAHETMLWRAVAGSLVPFNDQAVIAAYSAVTGYDPAKPDTDQGTDMQQAAAWRLHTGIVDAVGATHKVDAYASISVGNVTEIVQAAYLFGAVGVGVQLPTTALDQFDRAERWTDNQGPQIEGGHYFPCIGRNSNGDLLIVTWGRLHAATPSFIAKYMDEGLAYLSFESVHAISSELEINLRTELAALASSSTHALKQEATMATAPKLVAAELNAGIAAAKKYLDANVPGFERGFITDDMISEVVADIVTAVDDVRDKT